MKNTDAATKKLIKSYGVTLHITKSGKVEVFDRRLDTTTCYEGPDAIDRALADLVAEYGVRS